MKKIHLKGKYIGTLGSFDLPLNRLTILTAGSGMGKSLLSRALCFMANAGAMLDELMLCSMISCQFDLVEDIIHRIDESTLDDSDKNALLDTLELEGLHEENIGSFREKGFVEKEEEEEWRAFLSADWTSFAREERTVTSDTQEEIIKDAVLRNFPGLFHDGYEEKGEHSLEMTRMLGDKKSENIIGLAFDGEGELERAYLPFTRNAVLFSETPLCSTPWTDDDDFSPDYESVHERMYLSLVNHAEKDDEELTEEEETFFSRLDKAADDLMARTIEGTVDYDSEEREFTYTRSSDGAKFYLEDMSRGIQLIADIALMVKKRQILPDSIVIFDSVDSGLSPRWQRVLSEFINRLCLLGPRVFVTTRGEFADIIGSELYGIREKDVTYLRADGSSQGSFFFDEEKESRERAEFLEHFLDEGGEIW